jgi:hypothetical protein
MGKRQGNSNNIIGIVKDSNIQQNANDDGNNLHRLSAYIEAQLSNTDRELIALQNNITDPNRSRQDTLAGRREAYAEIKNFIAAISL